jgi:hypothetical protein
MTDGVIGLGKVSIMLSLLVNDSIEAEAAMIIAASKVKGN